MDQQTQEPLDEPQDLLDREFLARLQAARTPEVVVSMEPHSSWPRFKECGKHKMKHLHQESCLLSHVDTVGITDVLEMGCGAADLSYHLARVVSDRPITFHLLDRQTFRSRKRRDYLIRAENHLTNRLTLDVLNFELDSLLQQADQRFLFLSKHFCGFATDVALQRFSELPGEGGHLLAMAPCCHGLIREELFFGDVDFLRKELSFEDPLPMLRRYSGWATMNVSIEDYVCPTTGLLRSEKKVLGAKCKTLLNVARARNLPRTRVVQYTHQSVENQLLINS